MIQIEMRKLSELHPQTDMFGREIAVGSRVLSLNVYMLTSTGRILGFERGGVYGVVKHMSVDLEGCPRYGIAIEGSYMDGQFFDGSNEDGIAARDRYAYPPVNGTPTSFGETTFGVFVLEGDL